MDTMVFVNFPVQDVGRSVEFYTKLGFKQNKEFSTEEASAMVWDDTFWVMLLTHDFYKKFLKNKEIADTKKMSGALIAFSLANAAEVKRFGEIAKENGGSYHTVDMGIPEEEMYSLEVQDPDGNTLEPMWMKI
ncbi:VOC family protein [Enterococcus mundtii]|uniref:VOC family protein n=1 Tax=Enterococcus TaxID=1350 RepID=UPI00044F2044|nr:MULTISPECIES: VOC family protein [Enterococcus]AZP92583.1 glyoxalase [Enterococcus mundtii]EYT96245.1 glyoxalase [Enterococcus mundtii CRL35]MDA9429515.1 Glyoxalase family protein [Enterococcus mundtii 1A]MDK4211624.1 VOC family protein [Enterococcus mundtii]MDO7879771.1 VOC family protein [Enterococcus mundtii]